MLHQHDHPVEVHAETSKSQCRRRVFLVSLLLSWLVFIVFLSVQFGCGDKCVPENKRDIVVPIIVVSCGVGGFLLGIVYVNCAFWLTNPFT